MKKQKIKQHSIVIGGYYGYGSIGDEAVLSAILEGIAKKLPGSRITVLCKDESDLSSIEGITVCAAKRTDPLSVLHSLINCEIYISGGGSLLQDSTSKRSLSYYCMLMRLAKLCGCRVYVYANGIGPVKNKRLCRSSLLLADLVSVRDPDSLTLAREITNGRCEPILSADPIFTAKLDHRRDFFSKSFSSLSQKPFFAVSVRKLADGRAFDKEELLKAVLSLKEEGLIPVFVPMQESYDLQLSQLLADRCGGTVCTPKNANELFQLLEKASFALGMRLHFLLTAAIAGIPAVALSYDRKVDSCIKLLGSTPVLSCFDFSCDALLSAVKDAKKSFSKKETEAKCRELKALALSDCEALFSLLNESGKNAEKFFADT